MKYVSALCFSLHVSLAFFTFTSWSFAKDPKAISSRDIPSVSEVLKDWTPLPKQNPYSSDLKYWDYSSLATTIAAFEKHFPGIRYATLGRDASATGWLIDSFYSQLGQSDRVVYLRGSSITINQEGPRLADFIESAGFSLDPKKMKTQAPMVIVDRTNNLNGQVPQIIQAAHAEYIRRGGRARDIVEKLVAFNFAGSQGHYKQQIEDPQFRVSGAQPIYLYSQTSFPEFNWNTAWHNGYGSMQRHSDGKWYGSPGAPSNQITRQKLLGHMYEFLKNTGPSFLKAVQREAKNMGYSFPLKAVPLQPPAPSKPKTLSVLTHELKKLVKGLPTYVRGKHGLSNNAADIADWFQQEVTGNGNKAVLALLPVLHDAKKAQVIGTRDIRQLVGDALEAATVDGPFVAEMDQIIKNHSRIRHVLKDESDYFLEDPNFAPNYTKLLKKSSELNSCYLSLKKAGTL